MRTSGMLVMGYNRASKSVSKQARGQLVVVEVMDITGDIQSAK